MKIRLSNVKLNKGNWESVINFQLFPGNGEHECLVEGYDVRERLLVISDQIVETTANKIRRVYEGFDPNQEDDWIDVWDVRTPAKMLQILMAFI